MKTNEPVLIQDLIDETFTVAVVGTSPTICNRMSNKAREGLILPPPKMNAHDKASHLKHDPIAEFRASPYTLRDEDSPSYMAQLGSMFKKAMSYAALRHPGMNKTEVGQVVQVLDNQIPLFGEPMVFSAVTRSADIAHTPDIRTRCIVPNWACSFTVSVTSDSIRVPDVVRLLTTAGRVCGIGDWRPQKGSGTFGMFRLTTEDDPEYQAIRTSWGRAQQISALGNPRLYDEETTEMLSGFLLQAKERGLTVTMPDPDWYPVDNKNARAGDFF